mmetsp:Transcript_7753/g.15483  ORF Transcript_7753/g.15483 Transcript_7753/m.15483 type:complete len:324 (-) Transcript_7753:53-1024(-)
MLLRLDILLLVLSSGVFVVEAFVVLSILVPGVDDFTGLSDVNALSFEHRCILGVSTSVQFGILVYSIWCKVKPQWLHIQELGKNREAALQDQISCLHEARSRAEMYESSHVPIVRSTSTPSQQPLTELEIAARVLEQERAEDEEKTAEGRTDEEKAKEYEELAQQLGKSRSQAIARLMATFWLESIDHWWKWALGLLTIKDALLPVYLAAIGGVMYLMLPILRDWAKSVDDNPAESSMGENCGTSVIELKRTSLNIFNDEPQWGVVNGRSYAQRAALRARNLSEMLSKHEASETKSEDEMSESKSDSKEDFSDESRGEMSSLV